MPCLPGSPKFSSRRFRQPIEGRGSSKHLSVLRENVPISQDSLRAVPLSGGPIDSTRVRNILQFYAQLPDERVIYIDHAAWQDYQYLLNNLRASISAFTVPDSRSIMIDSITFHAKAVGSFELLEAGSIEENIELHFEVGNKSPVELQTTIIDPVAGEINRTAFPFLNERIGSTEAFFTITARTGNQVQAYYITRSLPPVAIDRIGWRFRGWLVDASIVQEILEAQR